MSVLHDTIPSFRYPPSVTQETGWLDPITVTYRPCACCHWSPEGAYIATGGLRLSCHGSFEGKSVFCSYLLARRDRFHVQ